MGLHIQYYSLYIPIELHLHGDVEKSVGRILRKKVYDIEQLVVDFIDNFSAFKNQGKNVKHFIKSTSTTLKNIVYLI